LYIEAEKGGVEEKRVFAEKVEKILQVLKNESGTFDDTNNAIFANVLERAFPKILKNESAIPMFRRMEETDQLRQAKVDEAAARRALQASLDTGDVVGRRMAEEKLTEAVQTRINLEAGFLNERWAPDITFDEWIGNFGAVDDLLLVGSLVKDAGLGAFRYGRRSLPRILKRANAASGDITIAAVERGLVSGSPVVLGATVSKEELLQSILPSVRNNADMASAVNAAPNVIRLEQETLDQAKQVVSYMRYSADEQAEAFGEITENIVRGSDAAPAAINVAGSTVSLFRTTKGETAVTVEGLFGSTKGLAFSSAKQAREAARRMFGSDANIRVLKMESGDGGKLVDVAEGATGRGKFYFSTRTNLPYEAATNVNSRLAFGEGSIRPGLLNRLWWKTAGRVGKLTFQPLSYFGLVFDKSWSLASNATYSGEKFLKDAFVKQIGRAIDGLGDEELDAVNSVIRQGATQAKSYTRAELEAVTIAGGYRFTKGVERAYYGYRRAMDNLHMVMDDYARRQLFAGGYKELVGPLGRIGFGKARTALKESAEVFDASKNAIVRMTPTEMQAAEKSGMMLYQLERSFRLGKKETMYVLQGGKVQARALPARGVLPRIEGYVPRVYKAPYIVYGIKDGVERIIGTAASKADGERLVARLKDKRASGKGLRQYTNFGVRTDTRTLNMGESASLAEEIMGEAGGLGFGQRTAKRLLNASPDIMDNTLEPVEAAIRTADAVSYQVTKGDLLRQMEDRAFNMARSRMKGEEQAKLLTLEDYINHFRAKGWDKEADEIAAVVAQINVTRAMPDAVGTTVEMIYTLLERAFSAMGMRNLAAGAAEKAAQRSDPLLGKLMAFQHFTAVASNFTGQIAMQMMQPMLLLGLGPASAVRGYRTASASFQLLTMRAMGADPKLVTRLAKRIAPLTGMTPDEFDGFLKAAERSGIFQSVANDTRIRISARDRATELMLNRAARKGQGKAGGWWRLQANKMSRLVGGGATNVAGKVELAGFSASEMANQLITFAALYSRDKAKGIANIASRKYVDDLTGRTRELTGSMNPESSYGFQRGFFKPMFQFVSFPWKMTQLALPESLGGSRVLSAGEKRAVLGAQFVLYGAAGVPFVEPITKRINEYVLGNIDALGGEDPQGFAALWTSDVVQNALQGYVMDRGLNAVLNDVDEGTELNVPGRFAPMGGTSFAVERFLEPFQNPDMKTPVEMWLGMPGNQGSKVYDFVKTAYNVTLGQLNSLDTVPFDQRLEQLGKEGLSILLAQYRRELTLEMAEAMDGFSMGGGYVSQERLTETEKLAYRLFNLETTDREDYWKLRDEYGRGRGGWGRLEREEEANKYASDYFNQLLRNNAMWHDQLLPSETIKLLQDDWVGEQTLLFSVAFDHDPEMAELIRDKVQGKLDDVMKNGQRSLAEQQLVDTIIGKFDEGVIKNVPSVANYLYGSDALSDAQKAQVQQAMIQLFEDEGQ
jgi:hypothetical protein